METCIVTFMNFLRNWEKKLAQKLWKILSSLTYYSERNVDRNCTISSKMQRNFLNSFITNVGRKVALTLGDITRFERLKAIYEKLNGSHGVRLLRKEATGKWATKAIWWTKVDVLEKPKSFGSIWQACETSGFSNWFHSIFFNLQYGHPERTMNNAFQYAIHEL